MVNISVTIIGLLGVSWFTSVSCVAPSDLLSNALKQVFTNHASFPLNNSFGNENETSLSRRCFDFLACEFHLPAVELKNAVFHNGQIHVAKTKKVLQEVKALEQIFAARKESYLPSSMAIVGEVTSWIGGPKIVVHDETSSTYRQLRKSCTNVNTSAYFLFPWEPHNAFHSLNDNVFSVLAAVIVQYLVAGRDDPFVVFPSSRTLYVFNVLATDGAGLQGPSFNFKLLHLLFGGNVRPAQELFKGGPYCVRHATWGTAMKLFYRDSLLELRQAVFAVFKTALALHRQSFSYINGMDSLPNNKIIKDIKPSRNNSRKLSMNGVSETHHNQFLLKQLSADIFMNDTEIFRKLQNIRNIVSSQQYSTVKSPTTNGSVKSGKTKMGSEASQMQRKGILPQKNSSIGNGKSVVFPTNKEKAALLPAAAPRYSVVASAAGSFKGAMNANLGKPTNAAATMTTVTGTKAVSKKKGEAIPASEIDIQRVKNYKCIFPSQNIRDGNTRIQPRTTTLKSSERRKPKVVIITRNSSKPLESAHRKLSRFSEMELKTLFVKRGAESADICCNFDSIGNTVKAGESDKHQRSIRKTHEYVDRFWDVDICVGIHGAGLANCAMGKEGVIVVEFQMQHAFGFDAFMKIAHMAGGHHIFHDLRNVLKVNGAGSAGYVLNIGVSCSIVDVAVSLFEAQQDMQHYFQVYQRKAQQSMLSGLSANYWQCNIQSPELAANKEFSTSVSSFPVVIDHMKNAIYLPDVITHSSAKDSVARSAARRMYSDIFQATAGNLERYDMSQYIPFLDREGPPAPNHNTALQIWVNPVLWSLWNEFTTHQQQPSDTVLNAPMLFQVHPFWYTLSTITKLGILGPKLKDNFAHCTKLPYFKFRNMTMEPIQHRSKCDKNVFATLPSGAHHGKLLTEYIENPQAALLPVV